MTRKRRLPVCVKCGQPIRKAEYMAPPSGPYHIVCPWRTFAYRGVDGSRLDMVQS